MNTVYIYGLFDPRTYELRYIGKTKHSLYIRLSQHISEAKKYGSTYRHRWILDVLSDGIKPSIEILEECNEDNWQEVERAWIAECRKFGLNITNLTDGGESPKGRKLSLGHIEKIRQANLGNKHRLGYKASEETRLKMSKTRKGKSATWMIGYNPTKETREKLSRAGMGRVLSEDARQKISESKIGKSKSDETKEKLRQANLGKKVSDETRRKMSETRRNPSEETRNKFRTRMVGNKNLLGYVHSEETKKRISEASLESWAKRKSQDNEN